MALRDELKKRDPFDLIEQEAALSIMRTSDLLENRFARLLREYDLTRSQYNVLRILRGEGRPMPCLEVAQRMIQVAPAITRVVDQLVNAELIVKTQSDSDRRVFLIDLTSRAKRVLKAVDVPLLELHRSLLSGVPKKDLKQVIAILQQIREGVSE
ncbi:MarR family winged helix-turn-helix transcriptional regulator [Rhodopirellula sallentina]|nr:MarR family transcriptional regulator [Rhodopirellula sallentina]